jgi:hypothetical protein
LTFASGMAVAFNSSTGQATVGGDTLTFTGIPAGETFVAVSDPVAGTDLILAATSEASLNSQIETADQATSGIVTITISGKITESGSLEAINLKSGVTLNIVGVNGATLDGNHADQGLFIYSGNVTIENLTIQNAKAVGGAGGFGGGGGGGAFGVVGAGGFGGGNGARSSFSAAGGGGGGLGAGGDIFVQNGATLTIEGGSLSGGSVTNGSGAGGGGNGSAFGSGIFLQGGESVAFGAAGQTTTISDDIVDQNGSVGTNVAGDSGSIVIAAGTVVLSGDSDINPVTNTNNAYTGGTTIEGGATLELLNAHAAGTGVITFDPGTLTFASGAAPTNAIANFGVGDHIVITDYAATSESYSGGVLELTETGGPTIDLTISGLGLSSISDLHFTVDTTHDTTTIACYLRGTLIEIARGQKKVEALNIGDKVRTASGALRPIKWIGRRSYGGRFIMGRTDILPICFKAGSLADNVPKRDLWISPHHAMYFEHEAGGVLIEAKDLVNGAPRLCRPSRPRRSSISISSSTATT